MGQQHQSFSKLKQDNFINGFIQHAANVGYQRSNRYIVIVHGPSVTTVGGPSVYYNTDTNSSANTFDKDNFNMSSPLSIDNKKRLALNCTSAQLSGKGLYTEDFTAIASGPVSRMPVGEHFSNEISLEFNGGTDFFERKYFSGWQQGIINPYTHDVEFYEKYAKPWKVLVVMLPGDVGSFDTISKTFADTDAQTYTTYTEGKTPNEPGEIRDLYYVRCHECYPTEIKESVINYNTQNEILKVSVKLNFKYWDDPVAVYNDTIERQRDMVGIEKVAVSPFQQFVKILRDAARYSDKAELKQLIVDQGLAILNGIAGIENVEAAAQVGQVIDVFRKVEPKDYTNVINRLIGPLGQIIK